MLLRFSQEHVVVTQVSSKKSIVIRPRPAALSQGAAAIQIQYLLHNLINRLMGVTDFFLCSEATAVKEKESQRIMGSMDTSHVGAS